MGIFTYQIKRLAVSLGMFRPANAFYRLIDKKELNRFNEELNFYSQLLSSNDLCFDVGANIGQKSEIFLKNGQEVVAFEPQSDCLQELKARCGAYKEKLTICTSVLGASAGEASLNLVKESSGQASLLEDWEGTKEASIPVNMITLDQAIERYGKPRYCKIDVEGYELNVLQGLTTKIPLLSIEYHLREREIETTINCLEYLKSLGEISINIISSSTTKFAFDDWLALDDFMKVFPENFRHQPQYYYGDIFVRFNN